ncbi:hypothetical protein PIB30_082951 [Stylosanthes scabra]|uniref:Uncharacterized protein n=1 Tax=Stylosanthes scabra TaxID=79078 RepID=A0ABU6VUS2_9FABA|nr:hypothetical protein [Stylosanthes scabra]
MAEALGEEVLLESNEKSSRAENLERRRLDQVVGLGDEENQLSKDLIVDYGPIKLDEKKSLLIEPRSGSGTNNPTQEQYLTTTNTMAAAITGKQINQINNKKTQGFLAWKTSSSQSTKQQWLQNENEEDTNTQNQGLLSELNFSLHRVPIKISTVQNEEPDEAKMLSKFQSDPTVNE